MTNSAAKPFHVEELYKKTSYIGAWFIFMILIFLIIVL